MINPKTCKIFMLFHVLYNFIPYKKIILTANTRTGHILHTISLFVCVIFVVLLPQKKNYARARTC